MAEILRSVPKTLSAAEAAPGTDSLLTRRHVYAAAWIAVSGVAFWKTIRDFAQYSFQHESSSHIVVIPFVTLVLLYADRKKVFRCVHSGVFLGGALVIAGVLLYALASRLGFMQDGNQFLSWATVSLIAIWTGGFLVCYGAPATRAAAFPLLFLLLMVPPPDAILAKVIHFLQEGSTDVAYLVFQAVGVPALRNGFQLSVPGTTIEVATECSGIRSSVALFITCLLATRFFLRTFSRAALFVALVLPFAILKNGVRIATLTLLGVYVDPGFLYGRLHRDGGFVFFLLALVPLGFALLYLQKSEGHRGLAGATGRRAEAGHAPG